MNTLRYRVIFNKTRGLLMAVSEIGRSHRTSSGADAAQTATPRLPMARMSLIAFAALVLTGAQMFCMDAARAQIVASPSAPKSQQPVVVNTANGLPQVNIATPSAAGVSHNTYSQFDVSKPGAILNNARTDVQTQLGGWIQRNPNLATGTARIILNEVNSSNPSTLRGYVEVAGDRAQVIIANPSGVTCDGCGFINASRSTLTTGTPIINNGSLDGYVVRRGVVTVQGEGMDASRSDFTDIITRAARINAAIWSKELRVTTGTNRVNADNTHIERQQASDAAPSFSIDVAQLGGMYANKIVLVGTEAGVGMRNAGNIGAAAGEVRVTADGRLENSGSITATQALSVTATGLDNRNAKIQSGGDMRLDVGAGTIGNNGGLIESSTALTVRAANLDNADTTRSDQGLHGKAISLDADTIDNRHGAILSTEALAVASAGTLDNTGGTLSAGGTLAIADRNTGATSADRSLAIKNTTGKIDAGTTAAIDVATLSGDGQVLSRQATTVKLTKDFTNTGTVRGDGNDLGVTGSNVVSTNGTRLGANNNVTIAAASDNADSTHVRNEVTSGLFSGGSFGVTIGTQELDNKNHTVSKTAVSSTVGSTDGKVSIVAGNAYTQTGSNVLAPKDDIDITGKKVDINAAIDSERNTQDMTFKQSGLTLQITSPIISAIQTVQQMKKAAESTSDSRMKELAAANVGFAGKNTVDAIKAGQGQTIDGKANQIATGQTGPDGKAITRDSTAADKVGGINLAISLGASKNESHAESSASTAKGSTVAAGGNVNIAAKGAGAESNLVVQGSDIKAGANATLKADNEVNLIAAQSTTEQHSNNKGMSGSVGVSIGTDGLLFNAGVSGSRGRGDGNDVTQVNTHVDAGNKLSITSGTDTTLAGAVASGKQVEVNVGTSGAGNLNIASLQDTSTYKSNQQSMGVSISAGMGKVSGSLNAGRSSLDGNYASVNEQSGINAGDGGFQVNVNGNSDLKGGKIASTDKAAAEGKNSFTTQTLTTSDIQNHSDYKAESQSVGVGTGYSGSQLSMNGTGVGVGSASGNESSATQSGITDIAGDKTVRSDKDSSGKITKKWDGQQLQSDVQAQAQITQMFGKEAAKAIGDVAKIQMQEALERGDMDSVEKWKDGGIYRVALHTLLGALSGGAAGATGAAATAVSVPAIADAIRRICNDPAKSACFKRLTKIPNPDLH